MIDYCLSFLDMEKLPFSERVCENDFWQEACTVFNENGKYYVCGVPSVISKIRNMTDFFKEENLNEIYSLCEEYFCEKGLSPDKHISIIRCFDLSGRGEKTDAVRLMGGEENVLFSDISYLVSQGAVYGFIKDGKVVSLAGAVIKDGVANIHIETAPSYRKMGYAKKCLLALLSELKNKNIPVLYECRSENIASVNTVTTAGGKEICRYVRFIGRK